MTPRARTGEADKKCFRLGFYQFLDNDQVGCSVTEAPRVCFNRCPCHSFHTSKACLCNFNARLAS